MHSRSKVFRLAMGYIYSLLLENAEKSAVEEDEFEEGTLVLF